MAAQVFGRTELRIRTAKNGGLIAASVTDMGDFQCDEFACSTLDELISWLRLKLVVEVEWGLSTAQQPGARAQS